jgi:hypothetical protein
MDALHSNAGSYYSSAHAAQHKGHTYRYIDTMNAMVYRLPLPLRNGEGAN